MFGKKKEKKKERYFEYEFVRPIFQLTLIDGKEIQFIPNYYQFTCISPDWHDWLKDGILGEEYPLSSILRIHADVAFQRHNFFIPEKYTINISGRTPNIWWNFYPWMLKEEEPE